MRRFLVCIHDATPAYARETRVMIRTSLPFSGVVSLSAWSQIGTASGHWRRILTTAGWSGRPPRSCSFTATSINALSEYIGEERVNGALRRLLEKHRPEEAPLATTLDLYRELQAVTPDSLQYLLHDLFEVNTYWELETERATSEQTGEGAWQVTLHLRARKVVADSAGAETEVPMDEWVEIGVFAPAREGDELGDPLYVQKHRIRSGEQTITVTVPGSA